MKWKKPKQLVLAGNIHYANCYHNREFFAQIGWRYADPCPFVGIRAGKSAPGEQLASAYASADIFAFPSTSETFGQVVLEAMASGLPAAGVFSEGVSVLVQHERTGLLNRRTGSQ
jgi:glycosyltransferase involved in cell wall biosynthesis